MIYVQLYPSYTPVAPSYASLNAFFEGAEYPYSVTLFARSSLGLY